MVQVCLVILNTTITITSRADQTLKHIIRINRTSIDLHGLCDFRIGRNKLCSPFLVCVSMTSECLLITCRSNRRNVVEVDFIPLVSAHVLFNDLSQFNETLTIELWSPTEVITQCNRDRTLTRHPLCTQTIASVKRFLYKVICKCLHLYSLEDQEVIPTTKLRDLTGKSLCGVGITNLEVNQDIAEDLTLTCTLTSVTRPLSDTDCIVAVFHECCSEVRSDILTTRRTDLEEQINCGRSRRLTSLHTICGTSVLIFNGVHERVHSVFPFHRFIGFAYRAIVGGTESKFSRLRSYGIEPLGFLFKKSATMAFKGCSR